MLQANVDIGLLLHHSIMRPKNSDVSLLLLQHGASVKSKPGDRHRLTVLNRAIIYRQWPVVQYLLDHSQHQQMIHAVASQGFTTLHDAVWARNHALVRHLCRQEVAVNAQLVNGRAKLLYCLEGSTPLHLAVRAQRSDIVTTLLRHGSAVNVRDNAGRTPLDWASKHKNVRLMKHLLVAGADVTLGSGERSPYCNCDKCHNDNCSTNAREIAVLAGYRFAMDDDERDKLTTDESTSDDVTNEIELIAAQLLPLSLQQQCANCIRRRLYPNALCAIKRLPLLPLLRDAILFHENEPHSDSEPAAEDICSTSDAGCNRLHIYYHDLRDRIDDRMVLHH